MNTKQTRTMDEIVFENRNKAYGAYVLRREVSKNEKIGFLVTILLFISALYMGKLAQGLFSNGFAMVHNEGKTVTSQLADVHTEEYVRPKPEIKSEPPKELPNTSPEQNVIPVTQPQQNTQDFREMNAVEDNKVNTDNLAKQIDLVDKTVGTVTTPKDPDYVAVVSTPAVVTSTPEPVKVVAERPRPVAEVMPAFPGGQAALLAYLKKEMSYYSFSDNEQDGKIFIRFYIDLDGSIKEATVVKDDVGGYFGKRALSVINKMPRWSPGKQGNQAVRVFYTIPITYKQLGG
ncbi:MAG TPA: energy transducer TonB [Chitinophagales bacterium]|nr:energy transducer TonB [Chitinophagales bacterium]HNL83588.1 energy transducer TonB [Chitinophagales bacterium]